VCPLKSVVPSVHHIRRGFLSRNLSAGQSTEQRRHSLIHALRQFNASASIPGMVGLPVYFNEQQVPKNA
jgi:hypothetical protein